MKQSSIEYLYERLERMMPRTSMYNIDKEDYFNQAKQMHKQEIIEAWENGYTHGASANDEPSIYHGTQYYKNTYEK